MNYCHPSLYIKTLTGRHARLLTMANIADIAKKKKNDSRSKPYYVNLIATDISPV